MNGSPDRLDPELLRAIEDYWREQHVPWAEAVRSTLTADEIRTRLATIGITPTQSLIDYWTWQDAGLTDPVPRLLVAYQLIGLELAISSFTTRREIAAYIHDDDSDRDALLRPWGVEVLSTGGYDSWVIDCSDGPERGYVRLIAPDQDGAPPIAASLNDLLAEVYDCYRDTRPTWNFTDEMWDGASLLHWHWIGNDPPPRRAGFEYTPRGPR